MHSRGDKAVCTETISFGILLVQQIEKCNPDLWLINECFSLVSRIIGLETKHISQRGEAELV